MDKATDLMCERFDKIKEKEESNMKEANALETISQTEGMSLHIRKKTMADMSESRHLLAVFIKDQLKDKVDFGLIPGAGDKPSLWKPGAEKIANIFQLGSRIVEKTKEIDFDKNIATYSYTIEMFHIPTGKAIAQCEAICSSQEKKYRERQEYEWVGVSPNKRKVPKGEPVPTKIGDVLNTLAKMCQKRAYVGAVIIATAASDFFTMDVDEDYENDEVPKWEAPPKDQQAPPIIKDAPPKITPKAAEPVVIVPLSERSNLGKSINEERVRLGWSKEQLDAFIQSNFGTDSTKLTIENLSVLKETLKRQ